MHSFRHCTWPVLPELAWLQSALFYFLHYIQIFGSRDLIFICVSSSLIFRGRTSWSLVSMNTYWSKKGKKEVWFPGFSLLRFPFGINGYSLKFWQFIQMSHYIHKIFPQWVYEGSVAHLHALPLLARLKFGICGKGLLCDPVCLFAMSWIIVYEQVLEPSHLNSPCRNPWSFLHSPQSKAHFYRKDQCKQYFLMHIFLFNHDVNILLFRISLEIASRLRKPNSHMLPSFRWLLSSFSKYMILPNNKS